MTTFTEKHKNTDMLPRNLLKQCVLMMLMGCVLNSQVHAQISVLDVPKATALTAKVETQITSEPIIIDVRTDAEWAAGHHPDAVHIKWQQIVTGTNKLSVDKDQPIVLYCRSGNRAGKAKKLLEKAGYSKVVNGINLAELPQVLADYRNNQE